MCSKVFLPFLVFAVAALNGAGDALKHIQEWAKWMAGIQTAALGALAFVSSQNDHAPNPNSQPDHLLIKKSAWSEFQTNSFAKIEGWVMPEILPVIAYCDQLQQEMAARGGVVEIGVHHGKFFIALNQLCEVDEPSLAIDVFDSQHLNIDKSGSGSMDAFKDNLRSYCRHQGSNARILAADSTMLNASVVLSQLGMRPRFFSIDGGHTVEHTLNDLRLASECVSDVGIVFVDDILNPDWIGVFEGVTKFVSQSPTLLPLAVGFNKMLLCRLSYHEYFLDNFAKFSYAAKRVQFCGKSLIVLNVPI
jgi:hypothetical protein